MAQPPPSRLTLRGFLAFPYRLCNPPPAVGKVRSCGVTPVLDVRLDDVLARRHLPPIGLKDLEEYLLYVERAPENLYFILWLKDYTVRYQAWVAREKLSLVQKKDKLALKTHPRQFTVPPTPDPSLAMFYLRAKQTFFTPNGAYELNIPSDVLAPFHAPHPHPQEPHGHGHGRSVLWHSQSVHPDPAVFAEVAIEARNMLNESLRRFVRAAYTNVGSQRAVCGIVAGCVITLAAGVVPLVLTTGRWNMGPHGTLIRLTALPGLWFGLTVLIASLQGICLMIYFFGDLRQLRKFELARPTISRPIPIPISPPMSSTSTPARHPPLLVPTRPAPLPEKALPPLDSPVSLVTPTPTRPPPTLSSRVSLARTSFESCASGVCPEGGCDIDVSPAFFDDVPAPEGPATASCLHRPEYRLSPPASLTYIEPAHTRPEPRARGLSVRTPGTGTPQTVVADPSHGTRSPRSSVRSARGYGPTAGFIPNGYDNSTASLSETMRSLRSQRSAGFFDFDTLPRSRVAQRHDSAGCDGTSLPTVLPSATTAVDPSLPTPSASSSPTLGGVGIFGRAQYKCNQRASAPTSPDWDKSSFSDASSTRSGRRWRTWLTSWIPSFTAGVPAFATPLTQVESPVVKRAQWEVVVRAGCVGVVIAGAVTGIIVGVVP